MKKVRDSSRDITNGRNREIGGGGGDREIAKEIDGVREGIRGMEKERARQTDTETENDIQTYIQINMQTYRRTLTETKSVRDRYG